MAAMSWTTSIRSLGGLWSPMGRAPQSASSTRCLDMHSIDRGAGTVLRHGALGSNTDRWLKTHVKLRWRRSLWIASFLEKRGRCSLTSW